MLHYYNIIIYMPKNSPKKRCPNGTRRDAKTKKCIKKAGVEKQVKKTSKTITYDFDGGITTQTLTFPKVNLSYIGPANSEGIYNENFYGLNFEGSNLTYSHFINCNFSKTNMKNVNIDKGNFRGSDFRGAIGLNLRQMQIIKTSGGILTDEDYKIFKSQQKKIQSLAVNYNKCKAKCEAIKKAIFEITESNPAHGDSVAVTNKYKIF